MVYIITGPPTPTTGRWCDHRRSIKIKCCLSDLPSNPFWLLWDFDLRGNDRNFPSPEYLGGFCTGEGHLERPGITGIRAIALVRKRALAGNIRGTVIKDLNRVRQNLHPFCAALPVGQHFRFCMIELPKIGFGFQPRDQRLQFVLRRLRSLVIQRDLVPAAIRDLY